MVAAVLGRTPSTVLNCPAIGDVDITAGMLRDLGATVEVDGGGSVVVHAPSLDTGRVPVSFGGLNRIPILLVGPLLHRMGEAFVPLVGGDRIGARPVNYHVRCLEAMGAEVQTTPAGLEAKATKLHGARIRLPFPSVGATETVLLTAALAEGRTVLENSAIEPEVIELALFLQRMGARMEMTDEWVAAEASELGPAVVQTDTPPGFMTDWQSPLVVLFTQCNGLSVLHETLFEGRFPYVAALQRMGAEVELYDSCLGGRDCRFHEGEAVHSAVVRGPTPLHGTEITVPDIRGGFAYVLAAAAAEGPSLLHDVHHLERGYHRPLEAFEALGLPITRC